TGGIAPDRALSGDRSHGRDDIREGLATRAADDASEDARGPVRPVESPCPAALRQHAHRATAGALPGAADVAFALRIEPGGLRPWPARFLVPDGLQVQASFPTRRSSDLTGGIAPDRALSGDRSHGDDDIREGLATRPADDASEATRGPVRPVESPCPGAFRR